MELPLNDERKLFAYIDCDNMQFILAASTWLKDHQIKHSVIKGGGRIAGWNTDPVTHESINTNHVHRIIICGPTEQFLMKAMFELKKFELVYKRISDQNHAIAYNVK